MSLFDIYKAKQLGAGAGSLFDAKGGKHLKAYAEFNKWDEEWKLGTYGVNNGIFLEDDTHIACKNPIPVLPNTEYYFNTNGFNINVCYMDAELKYLGNFNSKKDLAKTTPLDCHYIVFNMALAYGITYNHDICINISKTTGAPKNGDYVPYHG